MTAWEVLGGIAGALILLGGVSGALTDLFKVPGRLWRWLRRFVRTVDIITSIPVRLDKLEEGWAAHIEIADRKTALLDSIATDLGVLVPLARDVHHEVKHNGGSSIKDAVARLESGVQGLYTPVPAITGPVTVITAPAPTRRRTRTSKETS